jgi:hypothetical protein
MAPLPETVIVGPFVYEVVCDITQWNNENQDAGTMGLTYSQKLKIVLKPGIVPTQMADTLWHEVKHAIIDLFQHDEHGAWDEEEWVTKTASLEIMVLRDNPDLVAYLMEPE